MDHSEDQIALAAEYALGTLDADERAQVENLASVDSDFAKLVQSWEFRLGALNQMVGLVEPRPIVWENIRRAIGHTSPQARIVLPDSPASPQAQVIETAAPGADNSKVILFSKRAARWRNVATAAMAIAAALLAMIGVQIFMPDLLPNSIRPMPRTEVVERRTPPPQPGSQYVALLQGQSGGPAFILTVDGATRNFTVRKVGAPPVEGGKSYELWLISDKLGGRPRSLGIIGASDFVERSVLASYDNDVITNATYAVTLEQAGGSPDGAPHSAPLFAGKLIETVPSSPATQSR